MRSRKSASLLSEKSRQSRLSADVERADSTSKPRRASAPASRRRVERDASTSASGGVRAARPNRERGLLLFVLEACVRARRRRGETRATSERSEGVMSFVISSLSRDSFGEAVVGGARARSGRGARRGKKRAVHSQTHVSARRRKNIVEVGLTARTYLPPRRRRGWATCPCCWYTRIRRRSLRRGTPWRARCGSARAGCRRSFPVASGRRNARVPDPGLERTLATSTQRAAG